LFEQVHANEITLHWLAKYPTEFLEGVAQNVQQDN